MPPNRNSILQAILAQALAEPLGLVLRTSDPARARQQLYQARAASGAPDFAPLQIRMWPGQDGNLVIVRGAASRQAPDLTDLESLL